MLRKTEADIRLYTHFVVPTESVSLITADPSDDRILECAEAASSDFIVSGDTKHILLLGSYAGIPIIKAVDFMEWLNQAT